MPRKILHIDLDAFFCSVEELLDPDLKDKEFAVGGRPDARGVVASCSYAARMKGVHSAMPMSRAIRLCPGLIIVPGRHSLYSTYSQRVMDHFREITPLVQQVSIDEAFLDVTDLPDSGRELAVRLQKLIHQDPGLPCSIGVATNKLVAKIATDVGKASKKGRTPPNAITVVPPGEEAIFLAPLLVDALWGVGPKTALKLAKMGIKTIGDLTSVKETTLASYFGKNGLDLARHAAGIDPNPVETSRETKSISQEITFDRDISDRDELVRTLRSMAENVSLRLREEELVGSSIKLKLRWPNFTTLTRQVTLIQASDQDNIIFNAVLGLFESVWQTGKPVRLLGVGASNLGPSIRQLSLWETPDDKEHRLLEAMDDLRMRYGSSIIRRGAIKPHPRNPDLSQPVPYSDEEIEENKLNKKDGPLINSYWVIPGRFIAGPYPGGATEADTRLRLHHLLETGINTFIDLTDPWEYNLAPYENTLLEQAQLMNRDTAVKYQRIPIADMSVPSPEVMKTILNTIQDVLADGNNLYLHCYAGRGRTGTVVGCYLVSNGLTGENALEQIRKWRTGLPDGIYPSPETTLQRKMILTWEGKGL